MISGANIVCFAKDWHEDPTSNNHVMRILARDNRVLWINSIATRTPSFGSGRDLRKMATKLLSFARGAEQVEDNLWVFTPVVLPFPHSRAAQRINRQILKQTLRLQLRRLEMDDFQLWSFLPTAVSYVGALGESLVVYYVIDEYSQFSEVDSAGIAAMERELCERADIVFVTANSLLEAKSGWNPETHLASHGVDHAHFAAALGDDVEVAPDIAGMAGPILGFFGLIHDWIDQGLIAHLARQRPDWTIVLIGNARVDVSALEALPNVHLLGRKPYEDLPGYCKAFSVGLIPFVVNELTHHVNPIKLREYLSAGLPVVSTPLPEVTYHSDACYLAASPDEFVAAVERALAENSPARRRQRSEAMTAETWEKVVDRLGDEVRAVADRRRRGS